MPIFKNKNDTEAKQETKKPVKPTPVKKDKAPEVKPKSEKKKSGSAFKYITGLLFAKMAKGGASELRANADEVNKLNVFPVPDGDTGDNMRMTIESGIAAIENLDSDDIAEVLKVFSHGMLLGARGNSGVILSQFFAGMSKALKYDKKADPITFGNALKSGVEQAYTSVMTPTEGTILTVAREATEYAVARINPKSTIKTLLADFVKEMYASLNRTPEILAVLKDAGVVDSGGAGLYYIMDGFNRVLNGEEMPEDVTQKPSDAENKSVTAHIASTFGPDSVMEYGYCTELLVQLMTAKGDPDTFDLDALKAFLTDIGNSVVCFKTESIVKLHVHTMTPERVLEYCRRFGEFITVKIENMSVQHTEITDKKENSTQNSEQNEIPHKNYAIVAVSSGEGISAVFCELGVDVIVNGGQTNNPSTNDFIEAFDKVNADHIFVLPNNGNIIMAAEQAAELYSGAEVHVVRAKDIGAGYSAIASADLEADDYNAVLSAMNDALSRVSTGYVSPSIRDADMNGVHINNGDTIGIIAKEIVTSSPDRTSAVRDVVDKLLCAGDKFMLTVFFGKDAYAAECGVLESYIAERYPYVETYFLDGGQDIYPYIFIAE